MAIKTIYLVAGESSGDLLGADLIKALNKTFPEARFFGIGGPKMQAAGLEPFYPMERLAVMGIGPILKRLPELLSVRKKLAATIINAKADLFIGIDAPEFNLGLEKKLKANGIPTVHYVSPSVWAWRKRRIKKIKQAVSLMLCLFPFEKQIYDDNEIPAVVVGHPLAKEIQCIINDGNGEKIDSENGVLTLAVLPGSRGSELHYLLPVFLRTIKKLLSNHDLLIRMPIAQEKHLHWVQRQVKESGLQEAVKISYGDSRKVMASADIVLLASGTATLEAACLRKPMVVAYKISPFSAWLFRKLLHIDMFALPNLLAGKKLVVELIQEDCTEDNLAQAVQELVMDKEKRQRLSSQLGSIVEPLSLDSSNIAAEAIKKMLKR